MAVEEIPSDSAAQRLAVMSSRIAQIMVSSSDPAVP